MKTNKMKKARRAFSPPSRLRDAAPPPALPGVGEREPMVRTQIYLSQAEHQFLLAESARRGEPMAAIIRGFIEEKMNLPEAVWRNNSLLAPPADPDFVGPEDGVINHDHYIYGTPKRFVQQGRRWVPAPPLPEDYHLNQNSRKAYDEASGAEP